MLQPLPSHLSTSVCCHVVVISFLVVARQPARPWSRHATPFTSLSLIPGLGLGTILHALPSHLSTSVPPHMVVVIVADSHTSPGPATATFLQGVGRLVRWLGLARSTSRHQVGLGVLLGAVLVRIYDRRYGEVLV